MPKVAAGAAAYEAAGGKLPDPVHKGAVGVQAAEQAIAARRAQGESSTAAFMGGIHDVLTADERAKSTVLLIGVGLLVLILIFMWGRK